MLYYIDNNNNKSIRNKLEIFVEIGSIIDTVMILIAITLVFNDRKITALKKNC